MGLLGSYMRTVFLSLLPERSIRARLRAKNASPEPSSDDPTSSSSVPYDLGFGRTTRSSRSQLQAEQEKEKLKKSFAKGEEMEIYFVVFHEGPAPEYIETLI